MAEEFIRRWRAAQRRQEVDLFPPLHGITVQNDICNAPASVAAQMPLYSASILKVRGNSGHEYPCQIARYVPNEPGNPYLDAYRLISGEDPRYMMEALVFDTRLFRGLFPDVLAGHLTDNSVLLGLNIKVKHDKTHLEPFHAKSFIPWALEVYKGRGLTHLLLDYEPGTDTYTAFWDEYDRNGGDVESALDKSFAHTEYSKHGFRRLPGYEFLQMLSKPSARPSIYALYTK